MSRGKDASAPKTPHDTTSAGMVLHDKEGYLWANNQKRSDTGRLPAEKSKRLMRKSQRLGTQRQRRGTQPEALVAGELKTEQQRRSSTHATGRRVSLLEFKGEEGEAADSADQAGALRSGVLSGKSRRFRRGKFKSNAVSIRRASLMGIALSPAVPSAVTPPSLWEEDTEEGSSGTSKTEEKTAKKAPRKFPVGTRKQRRTLQAVQAGVALIKQASRSSGDEQSN